MSEEPVASQRASVSGSPDGPPIGPKPAPVLSLVIPALNEELGLARTLERCLAARAGICRGAGLSGVEIIVVSDGSTDRTEQIARSFPEIHVLAFDQNRGYGAAIKTGFQFGRGQLLGFLDADGTCDPSVFGALCRACRSGAADVALGSRLGPGSAMPLVRRIGNRVFAWILGILSQSSVSDTASGIRVVRRAVLNDLYPLPDGLQFTPAMSAKLLLSGRLRMVEVPVPYAERVGTSKLSATRDGLRFLRCIVEAAVCFRPDRPLLLLAGATLSCAALLGAEPLLTWVRQHHVEEWMIYRILATALLISLATLLISGAVLAQRIAAQAHGRPLDGLARRMAWIFGKRGCVVGSSLLLAAALAVSYPGLVEYLSSGHVHMHWTRVVASSLLVMQAGALAITSFLMGMLELIRAQREDLGQVRQPDRVRMARRGGA